MESRAFMGNSSRLRGKGADKIGLMHELRIEVGLDHREATSGGKYNEAEIGNEMSMDTKTTETRYNRPVVKKQNDGETTRSEAENAECESRDTCLREYGKTMGSIVS